MAQTSYDQDMAAAQEGLLAEIGPNRVISRTNGDAVDIPPGRCVVRVSDTTVKLPAAAADLALTKVKGISVFAQDQEGTNVKPKGTFNVLRNGYAWVKVEEAVTEGDPVFVRHTVNGGNDQLGAFRKSADDPGGGATATAVAGMRYDSSAAGGALARVEVNLQ